MVLFKLEATLLQRSMSRTGKQLRWQHLSSWWECWAQVLATLSAELSTTGTFREELAIALGDRSTPELVEALFNTITTLVPEWGTPERIAITSAVSCIQAKGFENNTK
jgi:hypothetical protein